MTGDAQLVVSHAISGPMARLQDWLIDPGDSVEPVLEFQDPNTGVSAPRFQGQIPTLRKTRQHSFVAVQPNMTKAFPARPFPC